MAAASSAIITAALGHVADFLTGFAPLYALPIGIAAFIAIIVGVRNTF